MYDVQKQPVVVSTDVGGVFAYPPDIIKLYRAAGFSNFLLEIIPFPRALFWLRHGHARTIAGIHGRVGAPFSPSDHGGSKLDWAKIMIADHLIPSLTGFRISFDSLGRSQQHPIYLNVHTELIDHHLTEYLGLFSQAQHAYLAIENGPTLASLKRAVEYVDELRQYAQRTIGTFDLVHAIIGLAGSVTFENVTKIWAEVLDLLDPRIFRQIHLPLGLDRKDSLPLIAMYQSSPHLLRDLAAIIQANNLRVILENQHGPFGANFSAEAIRLQRIRVILQSTGIINGS